MNADTDLILWLDHLHKLLPAKRVIVVGAGSGRGQWVQYLRERNERQVTLIEADHHRHEHLKRTTFDNPCWDVKKNFLGREGAPSKFYQASLPSESGAIEPEKLRALWPNLETIGRHEMRTVSLESVLNDNHDSANWVIIDCFPALSITESAKSAIQQIDVVIARVVFDESALPGQQADLTSLQSSLEDNDFSLLAINRSRNPAFGHALFIRNPESTIQKLNLQLLQNQDEIARLKKDLTELRLLTNLQNEEILKVGHQLEFLKEILTNDEIS